IRQKEGIRQLRSPDVKFSLDHLGTAPYFVDEPPVYVLVRLYDRIAGICVIDGGAQLLHTRVARIRSIVRRFRGTIVIRLRDVAIDDSGLAAHVWLEEVTSVVPLPETRWNAAYAAFAVSKRGC